VERPARVDRAGARLRFRRGMQVENFCDRASDRTPFWIWKFLYFLAPCGEARAVPLADW
jgi:hypothetical protein